MALVTKHVEVRQIVAVTVDEEKFNDAFMSEFRRSFFPFFDLDEHICHLGQLFARGLLGDFPKDFFIEGYGPMTSMGIAFEDQPLAQEQEIVQFELVEGGAA